MNIFSNKDVFLIRVIFKKQIYPEFSRPWVMIIKQLIEGPERSGRLKVHSNHENYGQHNQIAPKK